MGGGRAPVGDDDEDDKPKAASATEGLIETANPNAPRKAAVKTADADMDAPQELSRRERCAQARRCSGLRCFVRGCADTG